MENTKNNQTGVMNMKKNILGNYLKNLREQDNLSKVALAEQIKITDSYISMIENGGRSPSIETLEKYSEFFTVDINHLKDLSEKQKQLKQLDKESESEQDTTELPKPIQNLVNLLLKVDKPLLDDLVSSFLKQADDHLIQMTPKYNLTDIRKKYQKVLAFENSHDESIVIEGLLNLPEDTNFFFRLLRNKDLLSLEILQSNRSKIDLFEKWIGPHVFSYLTGVSLPQVVEKQKGISFCWFSPNTTLSEQFDHLLKQKLDIDSILFNSSQLAWYIHQNYDEHKIEEDAV